MLKLTGKEKHAPYTAISLNKANSIQMTNYLIYYSFFKIVAVGVLQTYVDQTNVLRAATFCPVWNKKTDFFALSEKKTF